MVQNGVILTDKEKKLIEELRKVTYGRVIIFVEDGRPVRITEIDKTTKL